MIVAVDGSDGAVEGCVNNMMAVLMAAMLLLVTELVTVGGDWQSWLCDADDGRSDGLDVRGMLAMWG